MRKRLHNFRQRRTRAGVFEREENRLEQRGELDGSAQREIGRGTGSCRYGGKEENRKVVE